jgi:hypothetical protein
MENTITRIADLPLDNNVQMSNSYSPIIPSQAQNRMDPIQEQANNYMPINIHPNPYGISAQNPIMSPPQQPNISQKQQIQQQNYLPPSQNIVLSEEQQYQLQNMSHQRLPSRDIPRDEMLHTHDEQVKPNYIPKSNVSSDYVRDYEDMTEKNRIEYENKKKESNRIDNFLSEFQTPLFVAILFFFFQLPIINQTFFKPISFLSLHNLDGNFNFYGLFLKSLLFGSVYYSVFKIINFMVEL